MSIPTLRYGDGFPDVTPELQESVRKLQKALQYLGYSLTINGLFDRQTENAVTAFQQTSHLETDGIVRKSTWKALLRALLPVDLFEEEISESAAKAAEKKTASKPSSTPYPELKYRDGHPDTTPHLRDDVRRLNSWLSKLGYSVNREGFFSKTTEDAVIAFQRASGLQYDGIVREDTWKALESAVESAGPADEAYPSLKLWDGFDGPNAHLREHVMRLQSRLKVLGFPIEEDGLFSLDTEDAVKDFQLACGLVTDGEVDKATWMALERQEEPIITKSAPLDSEREALEESTGRTFSGQSRSVEERPPASTSTAETSATGDSGTSERKRGGRLFARESSAEPAARSDTRESSRGIFSGLFGKDSASATTAASSSAPSPSSRPVLKYGDGFPDSNPHLKEDVKYAQQLLKSLGYAVDVDGLFGQGTEDAVVAFQRAGRLEMDGIVESNTWAALEEYAPAQEIPSQPQPPPTEPESGGKPSTPPPSPPPASGEFPDVYYPTLKYKDGFNDTTPHLNKHVRRMQEALGNAGFPGDADGLFGSGTESLVKEFQLDHNISAQGVVGSDTWKALEKYSLAPNKSSVLNEFWGDANWVHNWEGHNGSAYWPGGSSGVTLDPGMDLGHANPSLIENLYEPLLSADQMKAVKNVLGIKGDAAKAALDKDPVLKTISISRAQADEIFDYAAVPYWDGIANRFPTIRYPDTIETVQTVMLSLSYNRGYGNSDLEQLRSPLEQRDWWKVADIVGNMQQDHSLEGIRKRRRAEGDLIRSELNWAKVNA